MMKKLIAIPLVAFALSGCDGDILNTGSIQGVEGSIEQLAKDMDIDIAQFKSQGKFYKKVFNTMDEVGVNQWIDAMEFCEGNSSEQCEEFELAFEHFQKAVELSSKQVIATVNNLDLK